MSSLARATCRGIFSLILDLIPGLDRGARISGFDQQLQSVFRIKNMHFDGGALAELLTRIGKVKKFIEIFVCLCPTASSHSILGFDAFEPEAADPIASCEASESDAEAVAEWRACKLSHAEIRELVVLEAQRREEEAGANRSFVEATTSVASPLRCNAMRRIGCEAGANRSFVEVF
eukprot:symbB.v1.2.008377.t2/scaffold525.1/size192214/2